ncbi:MAG: TetR/AcrR family transcriptional regulator C-terminal domain-containing protein [Gammaproteobacteria bacterium]
MLEFLVSPEHLQFMRVVAASSNVPEPILQDIFTQGARNTLEQLEQWLTALQQSGLLQCENPVRSAEALVGMLLRLDIVRTRPVSVDNSEAEIQAHARFVVDGFVRM